MKKDSNIKDKLHEASFLSKVNRWSAAQGFAACALTHLDGAELDANARRLKNYLDNNYHATMAWMTRLERAHPKALWQDAKTALVLAASYKPDFNPLELLNNKTAGAISVYAHSEDYHRALGKKTKALAQQIQQAYSCQVKTFVDTAPLMEKPLGALAGLGWQGKHSNLVSKKLGSWFFLAVILTDLDIETKQEAHKDNCGSCQQCLDICPTKAFSAPYVLDSRRCISYLTIEHKGHIAREFRALLGNRIYGCDDCLAVCPWNKFAATSKRMTEFNPTLKLNAPTLGQLLKLNDDEFREFFRHNPIKRIGRVRFVRNVLLAIGNSADKSFLPKLEPFIQDSEPLLRLAAIWATQQLSSRAHFNKLKQRYLTQEKDEEVLAEWHYSA